MMWLEQHRTAIVNAALTVAALAVVAVLALDYVGWGPIGAGYMIPRQ